jgi:hypothetical protein
MRSNISQPLHKQWFKPSRLIPLLTILGAGAAIVLSLLNILALSLAEDIIIALLALLAVDALIERLSLLEKIEAKLGGLLVGQTLRKRDRLPPVEEQASHASEICVAAMSGIALISRHYGFFEKKLKSGCSIRIILLNPACSALQTLDLLSKVPVARTDTTSSLEYLRGLLQLHGTNGRCNIRLSNVFLPFSLFAVDLSKESGSMVIEFLTYRMPFSERPHIFLTQAESPYWFDFYKQRFEQAWSDAHDAGT